MFFPYSTDAPVYYWPFATIGLIVANLLVFCVITFSGADSDAIVNGGWVLMYGDGLHPNQWVQSIFMHGGVGHLLGNMLFLWLFGLIVEGKLGWWRFLCCYLAIGVGESALEQFVMLGAAEPTPGSIGASAAIYGLMAMAAIWAPMNEITFFYFIFFRPGTVDISIAMLAGLYAGWEVIMLCILGTEAGASWLHLAGFFFGLPIAIVLLKRGIVDCEGWDAFHVWSGDYGSFKKEPAPAEVFANVDSQRRVKDESLLGGAQEQFRQFLKQGNVAAAVKMYEKMKGVRGGIAPDRSEWLAMIQLLHNEKRWADSAPYMAKCIAAFPEGADPVRVKLAQICVVELHRPGKALEVLAEVNPKQLPEKQRPLVDRIRAKAHAMQDEGVVELDDDSW